MNRLRILILGPVYPYRGGIAHDTAMLAQTVGEHHTVKVVSFRRQYPAWLYPGRSDKDPSRKKIETPAEFILDSLNPLSWWQTAQWIRRWKPDLVVIQWWVTFWAPAFALIAYLCRKSNIPVLFLVHNVLPHEGGRLHRPLARLALSQGASFIVHTNEELQRLHTLIPKARIQVCSLGIFDILVESPISREEARKRLGIPDRTLALLFFGIIRPYKGLNCLLEAVALLKEQGHKVCLIVAGEFWDHKDSYLERIAQLGLTEHVLMEDRYIPNEEIPLFFTASDVVVAPYTGGTQSGVAAIALGYQIPLIATPKSVAGIASDDRNAVTIVPAGNAAALAQAICQIPLRETITSAGLRDSRSSGWAEMLKTIEKAYCELTGVQI